MANNAPKLQLLPLKHANAVLTANSIRIVINTNQLAITALTTAEDYSDLVSIVTLGEGNIVNQAPRILFNLESYFGIPSWDTKDDIGGISAVWTKPGSAISPLFYREQGSEAIALTGSYSSGVFQNPRFVRGDSAIAITAIAYEDSGNVLVVFHHEITSGNSRYLPLPSVGLGTPIDGLLLRQGTGYWLFEKLGVSGPRGPERKDGRGESIQPGILRCQRLDASFQPLDTVESPFDDIAIFEFDADVVANIVYLFATTGTGKGYVHAKAINSNDSLQWIMSPEVSLSADLMSPSVVAVGENAFAAVLESDVNGNRRILLGQFQN